MKNIAGFYASQLMTKTHAGLNSESGASNQI